MEISFDRLNHFFNTLVSPPGISTAEKGRRRLFVIFLSAIILPLIIFGTLQNQKGYYQYGIIDYLVAVVLFVFIAMLRYPNTARTLYRLASILCLILFGYWVKTGAVQGYASIWVLAYPPFVFFLLGKKEGSFWSIIMGIVTAMFFVDPFSNLTSFTYPAELISRHLFALFTIFCFTYNYESVRESTDNELREHQEHLEELVAERTRELQKNNEELQASEKRYRFLSDNVNDLIWATDTKLKNTYISPSVYRIYGYSVEEARDLKLNQWYTKDSCRKILKEYREQMGLEKMGNADPERFLFIQLEQMKKDGTILDVEMKVSCVRDWDRKPIGFVGVTRDISERTKNEREREKFQEQLSQAQKMEAIGTLVGGLAHDFNNILGGIMGSFDMLERNLGKEELKNKEGVEKCLNIGLKSSKRAGDLIRQLLAMSKKHEISLSLIDINDSLRHILELCKNSFPKSVQLDFNLGAKPLMIMGDMVQIEQVLLNLCINASHAMTIMRPEGEKQGGHLSLEAQKVTSDDALTELYPEIEHTQGSWVRIRISDTGIGMDTQTRQRIFEPFFTKKRQEEGTGLGLATSYSIVEKHGGFIHVESEPCIGSCFSLFFPAVAYENKQEKNTVRDNSIVMGHGTVLVIDDETIILDVARGILEQCGYDVLTAQTADKGIFLYRIGHHRISAVLLDLSMPGKTGLEVFKELKAINPDVRVLLSSGMLDNKSKALAAEMGIRDIVNKPYQSGELSEKILALLKD